MRPFCSALATCKKGFALREGRRHTALQWQCSLCQSPCDLACTATYRFLYRCTQDQYLELTTWLSPTATLYGAGERGSDTLHLK